MNCQFCGGTGWIGDHLGAVPCVCDDEKPMGPKPEEARAVIVAKDASDAEVLRVFGEDRSRVASRSEQNALARARIVDGGKLKELYESWMTSSEILLKEKGEVAEGQGFSLFECAKQLGKVLGYE